MHVRFSDVDEHYIKGKVESGFYTSENEVVRDAVRRMREEEERIARFQASVRIGDEQIERGETVPYSKELMEQIGQRAVQRAKQGKKIDNPDVLPLNAIHCASPGRLRGTLKASCNTRMKPMESGSGKSTPTPSMRLSR